MPDLFETEDLTFGFEAEFAEHVQPMVRELFRIGLVGMDRLHSYHCDCEVCSIESDFLLRAQQDSSCAGELISSVFSTRADRGEFEALCELIQDAAFLVDACAGRSAGFHVHVGGGPAPGMVAAGFVLAEAALEKVISPAALKEQRPFNESSSWRMLSTFDDYIRNYGLEMATEHTLDCIDQAWMADRHSNLWHSGRYGTNEFRLWNSTAAAWRMEMFVRCSLAMSTSTFLEGTFEEVHEALGAYGKKTRQSRATNLSDAARHLNWSGSWTVKKMIERIGAVDDRAAELLERQAAFHSANKEALPVMLTRGDDMNPAPEARIQQTDPIGEATESFSSLSRATSNPNAVYTSSTDTWTINEPSEVRWVDFVRDALESPIVVDLPEYEVYEPEGDTPW